MRCICADTATHNKTKKMNKNKRQFVKNDLTEEKKAECQQIWLNGGRQAKKTNNKKKGRGTKAKKGMPTLS